MGTGCYCTEATLFSTLSFYALKKEKRKKMKKRKKEEKRQPQWKSEHTSKPNLWKDA